MTIRCVRKLTIPPNERINFLVVVATRGTLLNMLQSSGEGGAIVNTIRDNPSFFLYEGMSLEMEQIYKVRANILADLSVPPQLPALAKKTGLSLTKMKQVFRQTFGDSIYNYYQSERMRHAAHLLKEYSVSEVGYHIGFSNLSHFTRVFERHHQVKPKRYKAALEG